MRFYIVIPAHNEELYIEKTLESLCNQTLKPKKVVVVNDNSTDDTEEIIKRFELNYDWISIIKLKSSNEHIPGSKIINAFYEGFNTLDDNYDIICKYDADLIFEDNYLENLSKLFSENKKLGMASGFCYVEQNKNWVLENLTNKEHIRGALKAYRKECFRSIGGLRRSIGWDTVDELLTQFYNWETITDENLKVKHLKPTGANYKKGSAYLQGEAMYKIRLRLLLTSLTGLKMALKKKNLNIYIEYIVGYFIAFFQQKSFIVNRKEGKFIRKHRYSGILKNLF